MSGWRRAQWLNCAASMPKATFPASAKLTLSIESRLRQAWSPAQTSLPHRRPLPHSAWSKIAAASQATSTHLVVPFPVHPSPV